MATLDDVIRNEHLVDIASGIRSLSRDKGLMSVLEMPERLGKVEIIKSYIVTAPTTSTKIFVQPLNPEIKEFILLMPYRQADADVLMALGARPQITIEGDPLIMDGPLYVTVSLSVATNGQQISFVALSCLLDQAEQTTGFLLTVPNYATLTQMRTQITTHISNKTNPHAVTKAQVGLGNVDDTSDINKPISTAQQAALNLKVNTSDIINTLGSTETTKPLSAAQGKALKDIIDTKEFGTVYEFTANMVAALNSTETKDFRTGYNLYILKQEVPDYWVTQRHATHVYYNYTDEAAFITAIKAAPVRIGYYTISLLETAKVDLTQYVQKSFTVAGLSLANNITSAQLATAINSLDANSMITNAEIDALFGG